MGADGPALLRAAKPLALLVTLVLEEGLPGAVLEAQARAIAEDYQPLSDLRGSADYRRTVAANLMRSLWLEPESLFDV